MRTAWLVLRRVGRAVWQFVAWTVHSWRAILVCLVIGNLLLIADHEAVGLAVQWLVPAWSLIRVVWYTASPLTYEAVLGGPIRRHAWRREVRRHWTGIAERCGLATAPRAGERRAIPRLGRVRAGESALTVHVRARVGQTVDDVVGAAEAIGTALGAHSVDTRRLGAGWVELVFTMRELLDVPSTPAVPSDAETRSVTLGRCADGTPWRLDLAGRHTLVVGRSGSGKGSIFWGVAGNLAPAAHSGLAQLWGIDLKGGVEVAVGAPMFSHVAMDEESAVGLLRGLSGVIVERQRVMRGLSRLFEPTPGDPVHVLMIDELAVLTAYASKEVVNQAANLLKLVLTQGRAFGVMVVAFVQDPRKETVGMRDLFTQTIALRLASASETSMVLGEGMAAIAPAHHISPTMPGGGYAVTDDGFAQRVRADYWSDDFIRTVAATYPAPPARPLAEEAVPSDDDAERVAAEDVPPRPRAPRKPRAPRPPASEGVEVP